MKTLGLLLSFVSIPLSLCLVIPCHGQGGIFSNSSSLDTRMNQQPADYKLLEVRRHKLDPRHNSTGNGIVQQIKRDDRAEFEKWLANRGGKKDNEYWSQLWMQFEKETGTKAASGDYDTLIQLGERFANREALVNATDKLIFQTDQVEFAEIRERSYNPKVIPSGFQLDWTSDACTKLVDKPLGFEFKAACQRNDFAILNTKRQNRYTLCMQKRISDRFAKDLDKVCHMNGWESACRVSKVLYVGTEIYSWRPRPLRDCDPGEKDTDPI